MNDFYRRFLKKDAGEKHYVWASRLISVVIMAGAVVAALFTDSIAKAFTFIFDGDRGDRCGQSGPVVLVAGKRMERDRGHGGVGGRGVDADPGGRSAGRAHPHRR